MINFFSDTLYLLLFLQKTMAIILVFVGLVVPVTITQFCHHSLKAAIDSLLINRYSGILIKFCLEAMKLKFIYFLHIIKYSSFVF